METCDARKSRSAARRRGEISRGSRQSHRGVISLPEGYAELLWGAVAPAGICLMPGGRVAYTVRGWYHATRRGMRLSGAVLQPCVEMLRLG